MLHTLWQMIFGNDRNVLRDTVEVFRENAEGAAARHHDLQSAALRQFATEFERSEKGGFDRVMDGVNRMPRPLLALGTFGLLVAAMVDPIWFAARMQGIALVPEPLWWLLGIIVSFYFGARAQAKTQAFQDGIARSLARVPQVVQNLETLQTYSAPSAASSEPDRTPAANRRASDNPALDAWKARAAQ